MNIYSLLTTSAIAALALVGCNKQTASTVTDPDAGTKAITVTINGANLTKAGIDGYDPYTNLHNFSTIDLYFTTASDNVVSSRHITATDNAEEWAGLTDKSKGVRYVGLDGVSKVYVIANGDNLPKPNDGENMNKILLEVKNYAATGSQDNIPFIGGDADITPLMDEIADGFTGPSINPEDGTTATAAEGQQYYTANIAIRPVISRLEIDKISVQTSGNTEEIDGADIGPTYADRTFRVHWENFKPVIGGIYMSNFYQEWTPFPAKTGASDLFATPTGQSGIEQGKWTNLAAELNTQGLSYYSNWNVAGHYDQLFNYTQTTEGENTVYFNGEGTECVPFNFLVNYDVTADVSNIESYPTMSKGEGNHPTFHIQFQYDGTGYTYYAQEETPDGVWETMDEAGDPLLYMALVGNFSLAVTNDNIYYANIVQFKDNNGAPIDIQPAKIYKMDAVTITPANLTTGTVAPADEYNVIVKVNVVDFDTINVTPVFE